MPVYYTYMVRCRDGSLYTGWTIDIIKRIARHNAGKGAKYTRSRLPVVLIYTQVFSSKTQAMRHENKIKRLSRQTKLDLAKGYA